eukprot:2670189-Rhodomonas_salina.2
MDQEGCCAAIVLHRSKFQPSSGPTGDVQIDACNPSSISTSTRGTTSIFAAPHASPISLLSLAFSLDALCSCRLSASRRRGLCSWCIPCKDREAETAGHAKPEIGEAGKGVDATLVHAMTLNEPLGRPGFLILAGARDERTEGSIDEDVSESAARSMSDQSGLVISPAADGDRMSEQWREGAHSACERELTPSFSVPYFSHSLLIDAEISRNVLGEAGASNKSLIFP